jgi:hypothetical protein
MEKIILEYLSYSELELLRNTCVYLHNFTKELRLTYRIFPKFRQKYYNKLIFLFLKWSRVGKDGLPQLINYEMLDKYGQTICPYFIQHLCPLTEESCNFSHKTIMINRKELTLTKAYLLYDELIFFISELFNPRFIWKCEVFIEALFHAFSYSENIIVRKENEKKQPGEALRDRMPTIAR